ncbi:MAG TPA: ABC transporter substrate-binding protein [Burkholderiales bacterium]|nr:ABC transporter substrate-binding protein [Burkholderiales bacterium]
MPRRREFLLSVGALAAAPSALAQRARPRIGYLTLPSISDPPSRERQAFLDGLADFGLVQGRTVDILYRSAENEPLFLTAMCEELLREKVDVLATPGSQATLAALKTTRGTPIVFLALGDPVGVGAADSIARPGRNATGVSFYSSELAGKRIEFLRSALPSARRVAFLWERGNVNAGIEADAALASARQLGIAAEAMPVASQPEVNAALARIPLGRYDALYVAFAAGVIADNRTAIAELGLRHRLPVISGWRFLTEAGGLLSYAPDIPDMFRRSAYYVDRILKGAKASELPIERATTIDLVINMGTARALGLSLPRDLLLRAQIIE